MDTITLVIGNFLLLSAIANVFLILKIKRIKPKQVESIEVRDLLRDLMTGPALVKIERVDPGTVFLHSPRNL